MNEVEKAFVSFREQFSSAGLEKGKFTLFARRQDLDCSSNLRRLKVALGRLTLPDLPGTRRRIRVLESSETSSVRRGVRRDSARRRVMETAVLIVREGRLTEGGHGLRKVGLVLVLWGEVGVGVGLGREGRGKHVVGAGRAAAEDWIEVEEVLVVGGAVLTLAVVAVGSELRLGSGRKGVEASGIRIGEGRKSVVVGGGRSLRVRRVAGALSVGAERRS